MKKLIVILLAITFLLSSCGGPRNSNYKSNNYDRTYKTTNKKSTNTYKNTKIKPIKAKTNTPSVSKEDQAAVDDIFKELLK